MSARGCVGVGQKYLILLLCGGYETWGPRQSWGSGTKERGGDNRRSARFYWGCGGYMTDAENRRKGRVRGASVSYPPLGDN